MLLLECGKIIYHFNASDLEIPNIQFVNISRKYEHFKEIPLSAVLTRNISSNFFP